MKKIKFLVKSELTDERINEFWITMLSNITDAWILKNFSCAIINSKFNEIVLQITQRGTKYDTEFLKTIHRNLETVR